MEIQWSLVLFTAISGAGAVLFACVGINEFRGLAKNTRGILVSCVVAAVLLALGGLASVTHLSHVDRMLAVLTHPAPGIFLEAMLIGVDALLAIIYFLLVRREGNAAARRIVAALAVIMGVVFPFSCGSSYMMSSQLAWNTPLLPLGYLGTAMPAGVAAWALLNHVFKEDDAAKRFAGVELVAGGLLSLVLGGAYGVASGASAGDQALLFWVCIVVIGSIAPTVCGALAARRPAVVLPASVIALVAGLTGSVAYRVLMWTGSIALMSLFGVTIEG